MKKPFAHYLTVGKADIDGNTSIEIVWNTAPDTFTLIVFRIRPAPCKPALLTEELGPFTGVGELREHLRQQFGHLLAQRLCRPLRASALHAEPPSPSAVNAARKRAAS